jgi:hypothetical protein
MIYELHAANGPLASPLALVVQDAWAPWLYGAALAWAAFCLFARKNAGPGDLLVAGTLLAAGSYALTFGYTDEVYINLEHAYNLYHHGLFSFSPARMVDGTVEYVYYLLLLPFAGTQSSLLKAACAMGFLVLWGHLFLVWRLLKSAARPVLFLGLAAFCLHLPLMKMLSSGFGDGLVTLGLLAALVWEVEGRPRRALAMTSLLPLVRPDAVVYALAHALVVPKALRSKAGWIAGAIAALAAYLAVHRYFYGHWIPTPVLAKSFHPSFLGHVSWTDVRDRVLDWVFSPYHLPFFTLLAVSAAVRERDAALALLRRLFPLHTAIFLFYAVTVMYTFYWLRGRYAYGVELFLVFGVLFWLYRYPPQALVRGGRAAVTAAFAAVVLIAGGGYAARENSWVLHLRVDNLAKSGLIASKVIPAEWSLAVTELNAFGFMLDREVIDLWGYTNRRIAASKTLNRWRVRVDPAYFAEAAPDVVWLWLPPAQIRPKGDYRFFFISNFGPPGLQAGDGRLLARRYDAFILYNEKLRTVFLVKKELSAGFLERLRASGYALKDSEKIDLEGFDALWDHYYDRVKRLPSRENPHLLATDFVWDLIN